MDDLERLQRAFIAADDAGNDEDARMFAEEIRRLEASSQPEMSGDGWSAAKEADQREAWQGTGPVRDFLNSGPSGLPFADEIGAGMTAVPRAASDWMRGEGFDVGRAYDRTLETERELRRRRHERSPVASTAAEVVSGLGTGAAAAKGGLTFLNGAQATGKSLMGRGMAEGSAWGALYGAGEGEGLWDRLKGLGVGTTFGGLLGFGGGAIAARGLPKQAPNVGADNALAKAIARQGITTDQAKAQLSQMGDAGMPLDLGPAFREQAEGLASIPGRAQVIVRNALDNRAAGAGQRITQAADKALGQPVNTIAMADDIIAKRSAAAAPWYEAAYLKPVPFTRELEDLLKRPSMTRALGSAQRLAADEGIPSQQWFANVAEDGTVAIRNVPDVRQLDLTKRALDDMISAAKRNDLNNEARILVGIKEKLLGIVDEAVPEYAQARNVFAGPSATLDAMETGKGIFKNTLTPNELRKLMADMGEGELEAFQQGARAAVADIMGTARNDANAALATFERGYSQEKLAMLVGKDKADQMLNSLGFERIFRDNRNFITGNSRTAPRQQVMKELGANIDEPASISRINPIRWPDLAFDAGKNVMRRMNKPRIDARNEALAKALVSKGGEFVSAQPLAQGRGAIVGTIGRSSGQVDAEKANEQRRKLVEALIARGAAVPR